MTFKSKQRLHRIGNPVQMGLSKSEAVLINGGDASIIRNGHRITVMGLNGIRIDLYPTQLRLHHIENGRQPLAIRIGADLEVFARNAQIVFRGSDLRAECGSKSRYYKSQSVEQI